MRIRKALGVAGLVLTLGGCTTVHRWIYGPAPSHVALRISAADGNNPNLGGRASPVFIRLYQLRAAAVFSGADFYALNDNDTGVLAADLLKREEILVLPGETRNLPEIELLDGANFLAVSAAYRDVGEGHWRAVGKIIPKDTDYLGEIKMDKFAITLTVEED